MYLIEPDQSGQGVRGGVVGGGGCGGVFLDEGEICAKKTCIVPPLFLSFCARACIQTRTHAHARLCAYYLRMCVQVGAAAMPFMP
jgi:hypothetical protein